jgi:ATP-binding cassette, subfamily B, bacterial
MKRAFLYLRHSYLALVFFLLIAIVNFKISFAMFDLINSALQGSWELFFDQALIVMLYALLFLPLNLATAFIKGFVIKDAMVRMKSDYLSNVFHKNISEFQSDNNALYLSALTNDFHLIETDYFDQILTMLEGLINFVTAILIVTLINPLILLIGVGMILLNAFISFLSSRPIKKHNKERSEMMSKYGGFIKEVLSAFHIIKTNDLEARVVDTYHEESRRIQNKKLVIDRIMSYVFAIQSMNFGFTFMGLMFFVSYLTLQGTILFSGVAVVALNLDRIIQPVAQFSEAVPRILSVKALFARIKDTLKNHTEHVETKPFLGLNTAIEFHDVSFSYQDNVVLDQVNLTIEKGKKILVVGPSGGGKSTVLRLLRKYFDPQSGSILVDGIDLREIRKIDYFAKIANIEQQVFLFEETLKNNLTLYKDYPEEVIFDAINRAGLHEFVASHSEGLDRMIYDNGKNISGGEKSRIAIARGLLNKAEVIFLDEAFASLDYENAKAIEANLLDLENVAIVNVSHVIIEANKTKYDKVYYVMNHKVT